MPSLLASLFQGRKPKPPAYDLINIGEQQKQTTAGNLGALAGASELATGVNRANQTALDELLAMGMPGFAGQAAAADDALLAYLRGEVPAAQQEFLGRENAAWRLASGTGSGGIGAARFARNLGLESDANLKFGLQAAPRYWGARKSIGVAPQFDLTSQFVSPQESLAFNRAQQDQLWNRNWLSEQIKAAPGPKLAHLSAALDSIADTAMSAASSYLGGLSGKA